ncbi:MAG: hypothetical protein A2637_04480 [Candidatus Muproteobacteria bacterium RIFCSPHIGHO2_01_FULL_65_16]|uniref:Uncharacterized protein n=2 Tax=Candidatus Muproteobacteria TaxID=1817795 RepID=A0A1F6THN4_9PROT|nr:MAG: hypothetical protein A2637_04480 [Candidatus Muproteobacteria bacterium RIFCSPHIGHO2_01_FULL_65_16]OGI53039.1 MAG: hypothetical protein A3B81_05570 [Candidatus Muproteobacteria bacterium RIFCSPHIGHO2_02_FULL_65_16]
MPAWGVLQAIQMDAVILVGEEARSTVVAALDDARGLPRCHNPWKSVHDATPLRLAMSEV